MDAGWFADPENGTRLRYWDGRAWTAHTAPAPAPTPALSQASAPVPGASAQVTAPWHSNPHLTAPPRTAGTSSERARLLGPPQPVTHGSPTPFVIVALVVLLIAAGALFWYSRDGAPTYDDAASMFRENGLTCTRTDAVFSRGAYLVQIAELEAAAVREGTTHGSDVVSHWVAPLREAANGVPDDAQLSMTECAKDGKRARTSPPGGGLIGTFRDGTDDRVFVVMVSEDNPFASDLEQAGMRVVRIDLDLMQDDI